MEILKDRIIEIAPKIYDYERKNVSEEATKRGLIDPIFEKIGWDFSDINAVVPEFPVEIDGENKPADYALIIDKKPTLLIEAKRVNQKKLDSALDDGTKKALVKSVPWLIVSNGDTIIVLKIDEKIPEPERTVFQIILSDVVGDNQALTEAVNRLLLLSPKNLASGDLKTFAEQTFKTTRVTNAVKKTLDSKNFENLIEEQYKKQYQGEKIDLKVLKEIMGKIKIGTEKQPVSLTHKPKVANPILIRKRMERLFKHPNSKDKENIKNNIREKKELWLEFIERKKMSTQEFKDFAVFKKKATGGFSYWLTYNGLATQTGYDEVRKGAIYEINEDIIPEIKRILDVT